MKYASLLRWNNLLLLALMQAGLRYGFYAYQDVSGALYDIQFFLLILATICLAGAGYVINDIQDQATDQLNKPGKNKISLIGEEFAWKIYVALNIIGVSCGFILSHAIGKPWFLLIFMAVVWVLYQYATQLKRTLLLGNLTIALLTFFSVMLVPLFDLYPMITTANRDFLSIIFEIIFDFALFAFFVNLIREIVKDIQDINGDDNQGMNTLPIAIGVKRTAMLAAYFTLFLAGLVIYYIYSYFFNTGLYIALGYAICFIAAPLLFCAVRLFDAKKAADFGFIAFIFKCIIACSMLLLPLITCNQYLNA